MYIPLNMEALSLASDYTPSKVKSKNNKTFEYWQRSLFQKALSILDFNLPMNWEGNVRDFFLYALFKYGVLAIFKSNDYGITFQPCTLSGMNFYYQPTHALISNPVFSKELEIGKDCEIIKLCPDYRGIFDVIDYYAEQLATLDNAVNMSLINCKFAFMIGARNKTSGQALKKMMDKANQGEPCIIYDLNLLNDKTDKAEPWQFLERKNLKDSYLTTLQLADRETILREFDTEIGIPTISEKKERLVTSEAETKIIDSTTRSTVWFDTLNSSIKKVNNMFPELNLSVKMRYTNNVVGGDIIE